MPLRSMDNFLSQPPPTNGKDDVASLSLALSKGNKSKPSASKIPVLKCSRTPVVNERRRRQLMFNVETLSQSICETKKDEMIFRAEELKLREREVKLQEDRNEQQLFQDHKLGESQIQMNKAKTKDIEVSTRLKEIEAKKLLLWSIRDLVAEGFTQE